MSINPLVIEKVIKNMSSEKVMMKKYGRTKRHIFIKELRPKQWLVMELSTCQLMIGFVIENIVERIIEMIQRGGVIDVLIGKEKYIIFKDLTSSDSFEDNKFKCYCSNIEKLLSSRLSLDMIIEIIKKTKKCKIINCGYCTQ